MKILHFKELGDAKVLQKNAVWVHYLWHFEDLGDTECRLAANAVVLVLIGYQISILTYIRGVSTLI